MKKVATIEQFSFSNYKELRKVLDNNEEVYVNINDISKSVDKSITDEEMRSHKLTDYYLFREVK